MLHNQRIEGIYNIMESIAWEALELEAKNFQDLCFCVECKRDMLAYALNRLPSMYVSTKEGESWCLKSDVKDVVHKAIRDAILRISERPHRIDTTMTEYSANELLEYVLSRSPEAK